VSPAAQAVLAAGRGSGATVGGDGGDQEHKLIPENFYMGTPEPAWLRRTAVPLFVSYKRLIRLKGKLPRAVGPWALDSGGFTELAIHGRYSFEPKTYARFVQRVIDEIGGLKWAAIMDWMCEPFMLGKTGLTIKDHQRLTCESYCELRYHAPDVPWLPVVQGYKLEDYLRHLDMYDRRDDLLAELPLVGVGSICRRQGTKEIAELLRQLQAQGLRIHAFGMKTAGILQSSQFIESADSQAWSFGARRRKVKLADCTHKGKNCSWCLRYALLWRDLVLLKMV